MKNVTHILTLLLAMLLLQFSLASQEKKKFTGTYSMTSEFDGFLNYEYTGARPNETLNGTYKFESFPNEEEGVLKFLRINGIYKDGSKDGQWMYNFKVLKPVGQFTAEQYKLVKAASGEEFRITGTFNKGLAEDQWSVREVKLSGASISDTLFKAQASFKTGMFHHEINSSNDSISLSGSIDEEGYLTGVWSYAFMLDGIKYIELREFKSGVMVSHTIKSGSKIESVVHIGWFNELGDEHYKSLTLGSTFFNTIYHTSFGVNNEMISSEAVDLMVAESNKFLEYSLQAFFEHKGRHIWSLEKGSDPIQLPKVKVYFDPLPQEDKEKVSNFLDQIKKERSKIDQFLKDPQVKVNRFSYMEISKSYEVYKVYKDELKKIENTLKLLSLNSFDYINRAEILPSIFQGTNYPQQIKFEHKGIEHKEKVKFPSSLSPEDISFKRFMEHTEDVFSHLKKIEQEYNPLLSKIKKKAAISEKEEILVDKKDSVLMLFQKTEKYPYVDEYSGQVILEVESYFKKYAEKAIEHRIDEIDNALRCMNDFIHLHKKLKKLTERLSHLEKIYTRTVWNPYTFTDMNEVVKERVYNAYENIILKHYLEQLGSNLTCGRVSQSMHKIDELIHKMIALRDQDTSAIEKELKRNNDLDEVLKIFGLTKGE